MLRASLAGKPTVAALADVVRTVDAVNADRAAAAINPHCDSAAASAAAAPDPVKILGIPLLVLAIATDFVAESTSAVAALGFGVEDVLMGLATQDAALTQRGVKAFSDAIPDAVSFFVSAVRGDVEAITDALGLVASGVQAASTHVAADAKSQASNSATPPREHLHSLTRPDAADPKR